MTDRDTDRAARPPNRTPLLIGVILAVVLVAVLVGVFNKRGDHVTPHGGTYPQAAEGPSVVPATPPSGDAPGTPAGVVNGPNQPAGDQHN